jgi:hypothetical protein
VGTLPGETTTIKMRRINGLKGVQLIKFNFGNYTAPHVHELPDRHESNEGENYAEDYGDDHIPRNLILNRDLVK